MPAILSSRTDVRATAILTSRSDVRALPFCSWLKDLVPSMSDVSVDHSIEQDRCKGNCHSPGEWRHLVCYQVAQSGTGGISDEGVGFGSYEIICDCRPF